MKNSKRSLLTVSLLGLLVSGCFTTVIRSGQPVSPATVAYDARWHHGILWGIAELSGPYDLSQACPQGWAEIETETSFLNFLLSAITSSLYSSQTVSVRCSAAVSKQLSAAAP
jgi:Bor protein